MTVEVLRDICAKLCNDGLGDVLVDYRDDDTDPDLDVATAYYDTEADRLIIRGY